MKNMGTIGKLAYILVIVGGLNWGLIGAANFNLVDTIFGMGSTLSMLVYILVGLSAVYLIFAKSKTAGSGSMGV